MARTWPGEMERADDGTEGDSGGRGREEPDKSLRSDVDLPRAVAGLAAAVSLARLRRLVGHRFGGAHWGPPRRTYPSAARMTSRSASDGSTGTSVWTWSGHFPSVRSNSS